MQTKIEVRAVADGTPGASWQCVGTLRPAIALSREAVALDELNAMVISARTVGMYPTKRGADERGAEEKKRPRHAAGGGPSRLDAFCGPSSAAGGSSTPAASAAPQTKRPKYRLTDKPGTVVWARDLEAALARRCAPTAYVVLEMRKEEPRVPGESPKVLHVEPLPIGSAHSEWIRAPDLASMEEQLPRIWHDLRPRITEAAVLLATEEAVGHAFRRHHVDHGAHMSLEALWAQAMRVAGRPVDAPAFLRAA